MQSYNTCPDGTGRVLYIGEYNESMVVIYDRPGFGDDNRYNILSRRFSDRLYQEDG